MADDFVENRGYAEVSVKGLAENRGMWYNFSLPVNKFSLKSAYTPIPDQQKAIDTVLLFLDKYKEEIEQWVEKYKS